MDKNNIVADKCSDLWVKDASFEKCLFKRNDDLEYAKTYDGLNGLLNNVVLPKPTE